MAYKGPNLFAFLLLLLLKEGHLLPILAFSFFAFLLSALFKAILLLLETG